MPTINVLPKNVAELIAAGEVVERPSSVIKELVENSIDAGATAITVEIQRGGITYIRVSDNGCGMDLSELKEGLGLFGMKDRAEKLGGKMVLSSEKDEGFEIYLSVPKSVSKKR